jgi:hypothetical protein
LLIHFNDIGGRVPPAAPPLKPRAERPRGAGFGPWDRPESTSRGHRAAGMNIEFLVTGSEYFEGNES